MNNQIIEAQNLNEVSTILLKKGFMLYRPEADVDGVDFIIQTPENNFLKCQLKSRAYVLWNKYGNKNIYMVFPEHGDSFNREWYLIPHDTLFQILKSLHGDAPNWNHSEFGEYWHTPVSKKLANDLKSFAISSPTNQWGNKILSSNELTSEMFDLDAEKDWEQLSKIGHSFNGYTELPNDSASELMSALYQRSALEKEFPDSIFNLRLLLFWKLRMLHMGGEVNDTDYEWINALLFKIRQKINSLSKL
jgi:hypothetical protein